MKIKNEVINEKEVAITYIIALMLKYETLEIMKGYFGSKFDDEVDVLFERQSAAMNRYVNYPTALEYLFVIERGNELKKKLEMSEEDEQQLALLGNQLFLKLDKEKQEVVEYYTKRLMEIV